VSLESNGLYLSGPPWCRPSQKPSGLAGELVVAIEPGRESTWSKNLTTLGDFNVNRGPLYDALISMGLTTPAELNDVPRTIFDESSKQHFYDQIAWFQENGSRSVLSLEFLSAGSFDFVPLLQGGLTRHSSRKAPPRRRRAAVRAEVSTVVASAHERSPRRARARGGSVWRANRPSDSVVDARARLHTDDPRAHRLSGGPLACHPLGGHHRRNE
jgi:hypothetical protein